MTARIGSLFSGYGGLDLGVEMVLDAEPVWVADIDKGACRILEHRYPWTPNLGDVTKLDWSSLPPVEIITGGSPCQDLSTAGKRSGMTEGTRSNLWVMMREAIAVLRPALVVWENVQGALSANAASDLESDPRLLDSVRRRPGEPVLRALGRVLGDLAELGYDAQWVGLRAGDLGAPHSRFRVFLLAFPSHAPVTVGGRWDGWPAQLTRTPTDAPRNGQAPAGRLLPTPVTTDYKQNDSPGAMRRRTPQLGALGGLLPTPITSDSAPGPRDPNHRRDRGMPAQLSDTVRLLPTPAVNDMGEGKTLEWWDEWAPRQQAADGTPAPHGPSLAVEAQRLLPTPKATNNENRTSETYRPGVGRVLVEEEISASRWGPYAAAITRWEETLGRPAPDPTRLNSKGLNQLDPRFVEWMMGLPPGWVTDVPDLSRAQCLRALGNGVCPQQAAAALEVLLAALPVPLSVSA